MQNRSFLLFLLTFAFSAGSFCCNSTKTVSETQYDQTRIIALLKGRVQPEMLVDAFADYGLAKLGPVSRTFNEWIFSFDTSTIKAQELLEKIRESPMVEKAYFAEKPAIE